MMERRCKSMHNDSGVTWLYHYLRNAFSSSQQ